MKGTFRTGDLLIVEQIPINELKKGDVIIFGKYSGTEIEWEGIEYLILGEDDILAKIGK